MQPTQRKTTKMENQPKKTKMELKAKEREIKT